ncbi:RNA polymerase sigma factor [Erythrobacter sp. NE805]|uniref:RNA polymerase sigma factor n=1 Tax=Erythrobacter sp. NE805 TaxID=3389875 RepID=UPI00396B1CDC
MTAEGPGRTSAGLAALIEAHRGELLRFLASRCGDADVAQDLLQELWLKLADTDPGPIANGRAYLMRAANNLALDRLRARRRAMTRDRRWLEEDAGGDLLNRPDPAPRADEALLEAEEAAVLEAAITRLPDGARRALRLYRFEGMKQHEIAEVMGITRSGVEKHLALAMKQLRDSLADCGFFDAAASREQPHTNRGGSRQDETT